MIRSTLGDPDRLPARAMELLEEVEELVELEEELEEEEGELAAEGTLELEAVRFQEQEAESL